MNLNVDDMGFVFFGSLWKVGSLNYSYRYLYQIA